jgi:glycosyltransferase involved in cell wall biosynthesis
MKRIHKYFYRGKKIMTFFNIYIIDNSHASKNGMSGGEKIVMELSRRWAKKVNIKMILYTSNLGAYIWNRYQVSNVKTIQLMELKDYSNIFFSYFYRAIIGTFGLRRLNIDQNDENIIYSASDFWPDSIPAFFMKMKNKSIVWIAGFYLFAPKPWQRDSPYRGKRFFIGLFYYMSQLPIYWIVERYADMVFVTSEPDVKKFITKKRSEEKVVVIRGGVDIGPSTEYLSSDNVIPLSDRKYDACFVGRFHYQKGVLELIDIWKLVCKRKPNAKLAMIGIGPLEGEVKTRIVTLKLDDNIDLLGFKDGTDKYEIFKQSKIIVHPATYDSGGMAAAEGMAWGLPGVSFDLEALKTYYPKGMLKTPIGNQIVFANNIIKLLNDGELYNKTKEDAIILIRQEWNWDKRAEDILNKIKSSYTRYDHIC